MASKIQLRRDTAANWTSSAAVLASGELGLETDTGKLKCGDGTTAWGSLAYYSLGTAGYAAYADTTANFTGTLQQGGSNVVLDSDIGSTVQAHDANLTSFLGAVDLPVADGSASQVLQTDGSGAITFADAATGGNTTAYGTKQRVDILTSTQAGYGMYPASYSYMMMPIRCGNASGSNHQKGNTFSMISTGHMSAGGVYRTCFNSIGFVCTPSTKTITVSNSGDPQEIFINNSGYGISTIYFNYTNGGNQITGGGHVAWPGQSSHYFGYFQAEASRSTGLIDPSTNWAYVASNDSHGYNGTLEHLATNDDGDAYVFIGGYNAASGSQGAYRLANHDTSGSNYPSVGGITACPNTNTSTTEAISIHHQHGLYPDVSNSLPTSILTYGTAGGWSKLGIAYDGTVSGEITSGFNRAQYSNQVGFIVQDDTGGSGQPRVFTYDYEGTCSRWQYNSAQSSGQHTMPWKGRSYGGMEGFVHTGVANEFLSFYNPGSPYGHYPPAYLTKFKINYTTGAFYDFQTYSAEDDPAFFGAWDGYMSVQGLYGDTGTETTPTALLWSQVQQSGITLWITDFPTTGWVTQPL